MGMRIDGKWHWVPVQKDSTVDCEAQAQISPYRPFSNKKRGKGNLR